MQRLTYLNSKKIKKCKFSIFEVLSKKCTLYTFTRHLLGRSIRTTSYTMPDPKLRGVFTTVVVIVEREARGCLHSFAQAATVGLLSSSSSLSMQTIAPTRQSYLGTDGQQSNGRSCVATPNRRCTEFRCVSQELSLRVRGASEVC